MKRKRKSLGQIAYETLYYKSPKGLWHTEKPRDKRAWEATANAVERAVKRRMKEKR